MFVELDDGLLAWNELREQRDWSALLLGNGFSQNIWHRFRYTSLYETASSDAVERRLQEEDTRLFEPLETHNCELVPSALSIGRTVTSALERDADFLEERYESIRHALIAAVHHVHAPWQSLPEPTVANVAKELAAFEAVYSSNYDLLVYWAMMNQLGSFKDYFWSREFDNSNTEIWGKCTKVHFLHGGLHLYRQPNGQTLKRSARPGQNLLDLFGETLPGCSSSIHFRRHRKREASLHISLRLPSFVFSNFAQDDGPMVVFGQSLGESDQHLIDVQRAKKGRSIAMSIRAQGDIRERKAQLIAALPGADLMFFDAATHPLGLAELKVEDPDR